MEEDKGKLELIAFKTFPADPELVYIIDFLNKTLKEKRIMFGLSKDKEKNEMTVNIYEF
ncbi:MAG: YpmA family protein [Syntrophomonas sp.]